MNDLGIKYDTIYFTNNMNDVICPKLSDKDLGIMTSDKAGFETHKKCN